MRFRKLLCRSQTRIDLLYTMSDITHVTVHPDNACEVMFRGRFERRFVSRPLCRSSIPSGGARRDRTDDLMLAKHALSQLSYGPVPEDECVSSVLHARSPSLTLRRSSLRSRRPAEPKLRSSEGWWAWEDLNFRPHAYQARALTN
jgi:hypothetical protein